MTPAVVLQLLPAVVLQLRTTGNTNTIVSYQYQTDSYQFVFDLYQFVFVSIRIVSKRNVSYRDVSYLEKDPIWRRRGRGKGSTRRQRD
jgi:hypothetical protein